VKRTPELVFRPDDVVRGARRVEDLLRGLPEPAPDAEGDVDG
jgi:ribosome-binding factor A